MYCDLVESEDFWPDRMKCRKWLEKNEWEKEQETRREEYERNRRERFERRERDERSEDADYNESYRNSRHGDSDYYSGKTYDNDDDRDDDYDYRKDSYDKKTLARNTIMIALEEITEATMTIKIMLSSISTGTIINQSLVNS